MREKMKFRKSLVFSGLFWFVLVFYPYRTADSGLKTTLYNVKNREQNGVYGVIAVDDVRSSSRFPRS